MTDDIMEKFRDSTAVITGASGGIGAAIAAALSRHGVNLHLVGRNLPGLEQRASELAAAYGNDVSVHKVDLSRVEDLPASLSPLQNETIDILIHCAGQILISRVADTTLAAQDQIFDINFRAPAELSRQLLGQLRRSGGAIVFVNSSTSQQPGKPELSAYSASKLALKAFSESLRSEENSNGVRVINVYPGRTASAMQEFIAESEQKLYDGDQLLQCEDVARAVLYALDQSDTAEVTDIMIRPFKKS